MFFQFINIHVIPHDFHTLIKGRLLLQKLLLLLVVVVFSQQCCAVVCKRAHLPDSVHVTSSRSSSGKRAPRRTEFPEQSAHIFHRYPFYININHTMILCTAPTIYSTSNVRPLLAALAMYIPYFYIQSSSEHTPCHISILFPTISPVHFMT